MHGLSNFLGKIPILPFLKKKLSIWVNLILSKSLFDILKFKKGNYIFLFYNAHLKDPYTIEFKFM